MFLFALCASDMSNAAAGLDESAVRGQHEVEGDALHQVLQDDLSSRKSLEADPPATHQDYPSSQTAMEGSSVDEAHRASHVDVNTENITQEGHGDRECMAQPGESTAEKLPEDGFDDGVHAAQHGYSSSDQESQEGPVGSLHRAQPWDPSWEQSVQGGGEAETKVSHAYAPLVTSKLPQAEKVTNAQNPHSSSVSSNLTKIGMLIEHGELDAQENLAACRTSGKDCHEYLTSAQDSDEGIDENIGVQGRSAEYSSVAVTAPFGTLDEPTHKNGFMTGTVGEHVYVNTSTCGTSAQHVEGNDDFHSEGGKLGKFSHQNMPGNGSSGEDAPGYVCNDSVRHGNFWGNVYDYTSRNNESDADAHEKTAASDKTGGGDLKTVLGQDPSSMQALTFPKSPIKTSSRIAGSSYYKTQSAAMKNTELALRFGSAIFSLIAFSVIISTSEKRIAAGSTFYVKFSDYQAYNYLAALNLLSFLYSAGQLVLLAQAKGNILSSPVKSGILLYLGDQILAFLMVSSSSSAATASELSRHGLHNIWPPACSTWQLSLFCCKADVAVSMSFVSFLLMLLSSFASGYHLSKVLAE